MERFERYREIIPEYDLFIEAIKREHPSHLRINTLKADPVRAVDALRERGFILKELPLENAWAFEGVEKPGATLEYFLGYYHLQGLSSMLPPHCMELAPGQVILDMCASPGSKTTQMAALTENRSLIVANELKKRRLGILKYHIERLGVLSVLITGFQAQNFPQRLLDRSPIQFDRVLLDAPCTGEGRFRLIMREAEQELMQPYRPESTHRISGYQRQMILKGFDLLKDGGIMVYSTCTYSPEENELVIQHLIENRGGVLVEPVNLPGINSVPGLTSWGESVLDPSLSNTVRIYPHYLDSWGFFIAKIRKAL
ncbi:MAG: RsmB/NOP family class I SAM-dependent RNA methyltransferase [Nitrospirae bacterium]|nr:MAG: RsmB/NOP family class I SAM-dependent RNA methyltransferase [Nitrospirota bacterium]